jgi:hypothetical protein
MTKTVGFGHIIGKLDTNVNTVKGIQSAAKLGRLEANLGASNWKFVSVDAKFQLARCIRAMSCQWVFQPEG